MRYSNVTLYHNLKFFLASLTNILVESHGRNDIQECHQEELNTRNIIEKILEINTV